MICRILIHDVVCSLNNECMFFVQLNEAFVQTSLFSWSSYSFALSFLTASLGFTCRMGLTLTAGLGVAEAGAGLENSVLVAATPDSGVRKGEMGKLVRNTGVGVAEDLGSSVLLCFRIVSVSAAAKLSAEVCREAAAEDLIRR